MSKRTVINKLFVSFLILLILYIFSAIINNYCFANSNIIGYTVNRAPRFSCYTTDKKQFELKLKDGNGVSKVNLKTEDGKYLIKDNISQKKGVKFEENIISIEKSVIGKKEGDSLKLVLELEDASKKFSNKLVAYFTVKINKYKSGGVTKYFSVNNSPRTSYKVTQSDITINITDYSGLKELRVLNKDKKEVLLKVSLGEKNKKITKTAKKIQLNKLEKSLNTNNEYIIYIYTKDNTGKTRTEKIALRPKVDNTIKPENNIPKEEITKPDDITGEIKLDKDLLVINNRNTNIVKARYYKGKINATINVEGATVNDIEWTSSDPTVATVDQKGNVIGDFFGNAIITARLKNNKNIKATCNVTVIHTLAENVKFKSDVTGKIIGENEKIIIKSGTKAISENTIRDIQKGRLKEVRVKIASGEYNGKYVIVDGNALKFESYYIEDYSDEEKIAYVNNTGISSKTDKLLWANQGSQTITIFKGSAGKWKIVKQDKCSSGDQEGKITKAAKGCKTPINFDNYVGAIFVETGNPGLGKTIHIYKSNGKDGNNTIHIYPSGTLGSSRQKGLPASSGCINVTKSFRNWIVNNVKIGTKVIYY